MTSVYYILDGNGEAVVEPNFEVWCRWMDDPAKCSVAATTVGDYLVSTVFLALDRQYGAGPPILFETIVFQCPDHIEVIGQRYSTRTQALAAHDQLVAVCRQHRPSVGGLAS